jgi:hypothetical protein
MLVEPARVMQCVFEAEGVMKAAGQDTRLDIQCKCAIRRTEVPAG